MILEILRQADGEWTGKTKLYKAFYFAHLYYAHKRPERLTDWPIARMPQGPGIHNSGELLGGLRNDGYITIERTHEGPYPEFRYRLTPKGHQSPPLAGEALAAVHDAAEFCRPHTAAYLSQLTHEFSRAWNEAKDGDKLDVVIDTIPADEYEEREASLDQLEKQLAALGMDQS